MFRFIKWTLIGLACATAASFAAFGTSAGSYVGTLADMAGHGVKDAVPIDFELARAQRLADDIAPQIERCKHDVARAEVDLDNLAREVDSIEQRVAVERETLGRGAVVLAAGVAVHAPPTFAQSAARDRVASDLKRRLDALEHQDAMLAAKRDLLERQRSAVHAARQKLYVVRAERERVLEDIESLRTQKMLVEATAATSPHLALDTSPLGEAKQVIAEVRGRLDVMQKMLEHDDLSTTVGEEALIPADVLVAEIEEYLERGARGTR